MSLLRAAWVGLLVLWWTATSLGAANASAQGAIIAYHDPSFVPLSMRIASELQSDGYRVKLQVLQAEPGCASAPTVPAESPPAQEGQRVWVRVGRVGDSTDVGCALISYASPTGWRYASVRTSTADVTRFSIKVAEALHGLRSRELVAPTPLDEPNITAAPGPSPAPLGRSGLAFGAVASTSIDSTHPAAVLGAGVLADLPLTKRWALRLDSLWAITPLRLSEGRTEFSTRFIWTRLGVAATVLPDPVELKLTASAGHAFTWVTAEVEAPTIARADIGHSAVFSAGGALVYPVNTPIRFHLALRASTLVPSVRFELPSGPTRPFGRFVGEGAAGLVASW